MLIFLKWKESHLNNEEAKWDICSVNESTEYVLLLCNYNNESQSLQQKNLI